MELSSCKFAENRAKDYVRVMEHGMVFRKRQSGGNERYSAKVITRGRCYPHESNTIQGNVIFKQSKTEFRLKIGKKINGGQNVKEN